MLASLVRVRGYQHARCRTHHKPLTFPAPFTARLPPHTLCRVCLTSCNRRLRQYGSARDWATVDLQPRELQTPHVLSLHAWLRSRRGGLRRLRLAAQGGLGASVPEAAAEAGARTAMLLLGMLLGAPELVSLELNMPGDFAVGDWVLGLPALKFLSLSATGPGLPAALARAPALCALRLQGVAPSGFMALAMLTEDMEPDEREEALAEISDRMQLPCLPPSLTCLELDSVSSIPAAAAAAGAWLRRLEVDNRWFGGRMQFEGLERLQALTALSFVCEEVEVGREGARAVCAEGIHRRFVGTSSKKSRAACVHEQFQALVLPTLT